jgi:hypothetical protein
MSGLLTSLVGMGGGGLGGLLGGGLLTGASNAASGILGGAMSDSLMESATAQATKMKVDTQNSILDGRMDSASKEINSGHNAAKAIQF